jgi:hypothetical protein
LGEMSERRENTWVWVREGWELQNEDEGEGVVGGSTVVLDCSFWRWGMRWGDCCGQS